MKFSSLPNPKMPNETHSPDVVPDALTAAPTSRRGFLRTAGLTALSAGALAACGKANVAEAATDNATPTTPPDRAPFLIDRTGCTSP